MVRYWVHFAGIYRGCKTEPMPDIWVVYDAQTRHKLQGARNYERAERIVDYLNQRERRKLQGKEEARCTTQPR